MPLPRKDPASPRVDVTEVEASVRSAANDAAHAPGAWRTATTAGAVSSVVAGASDALGGADALWQRFEIRHDFPVAFTHGLFEPGNPLLADALCRLEPDKRQRCAIVVDAGLVSADPGLPARIDAWAVAHASRVQSLCPARAVESGEALKNDPTALEPLYAMVHELGIDRHSAIVAVGGGALLDAVGLVAATAHRGLRHVRVPTTVLAQNDSGVGVKNGVNRFGQKNWHGTFAPPFAVLNDAAFLPLLGGRDRRAGMAEAVKVALIRDAAFFARLEADADALAAFEPAAVAHMIRRCAELHMHQIGRGGDPFEAGSARPLDFGHWAAHRLEGLCGHRLRHGEAVAIGVALDTRYSVLAGLLEPGADERVATLLEALGFTLHDDGLRALDGNGEGLTAGLEHFRTHLGGELTITLLEGIGRGVEVHAMDAGLVDEAITWLEARR